MATAVVEDTGLRFEQFVVARWAALTRSAYLLTGDQTLAGELVEAAVVRVRRAWRQASADRDPAEWAQAEMARLYLSRHGGRFDGPPASPTPAGPSAGDGTDAAAPDEPDSLLLDRVWSGLRSLPRRERAVSVLVHVQDVDDQTAAHRTGLQVRKVRAAEERGLAQLHATLRGEAAAADQAGLVGLLRRACSARLASLKPDTDPLPAVEAAVNVDRRSRHRRGLLVGGGLVAVVATLVVVGGIRGGTDPGVGESPQPVGDVEIDGRTWPLAGALAADPRVVERLELALARSSIGASTPPTVVFADDVGDVRLVLATDGGGRVWVLHGARGENFATLDGYGPPAAHGPALAPLAVLVPEGGPAARLVVVAPAGTTQVQVGVEPAVWPDPDSPSRMLELTRGTAVTPLEPSAPFALTPTTVTVRAAGQGEPLPSSLVVLDDPDPTGPDDRVVSSLPRGHGERVAAAITDAAYGAFGAAGFGTRSVAYDVVATDDLPCPSRSCRIGAAVVNAVSDGVRSRALAAQPATVGGEGPPLFGYADPANTSPSHAGLADPRPLVVSFEPQVVPSPVGAMLWADSPHGSIRYSYLDRGERRTAEAALDAAGFAWVDHWRDVRPTSLVDGGGALRWAADD